MPLNSLITPEGIKTTTVEGFLPTPSHKLNKLIADMLNIPSSLSQRKSNNISRKAYKILQQIR